ncbi:MAG: CDP-6-deoxy-delta-3,4-glucoseen reductase [Gammaproteobacteria bacterium]|nr:CDP-6-deoxy-delta-3,4-glucoseen reductase [Gammaproteobacteria bacterium]
MTYKVTIQPSGHQFENEVEETILEAALRHGFAFSYGCRSGSCGACSGKVVSGEFHYEDDEEPMALSEDAKKNSMCIFCQAIPDSDLVLEVKGISAVKDIVVKTLPARVAKMERLAPDVMRLYLKLPMIERMQFLAGQYLDILLKDGRRRSFSIANAPHDDELLELHIRKIDGGEFTTYVFDEMEEKALLRIEGPLGTFFLRESDRPLICMAGGTGFAPLKGILEHAFEEGLKRPIHLYWGARDKEGLYLSELAESWASKYENFIYIPVLSEQKAGDNWQGRTGLVHEAVAADFTDLSQYEIYASGRPEMIDEGRNIFIEKGLDQENYYFDAFTFSEIQ